MGLAVVQAFSTNTDANPNSLNSSGLVTITSGSTVEVNFCSQGSTILTVADPAGNTYNFVNSDNPPIYAPELIAKYVAYNVTGFVAGAIVATYAGVPPYRRMTGIEISGTDPAATVDATANANTVSTTTVTSGTFTTAQADEIIVAAVMVEDTGSITAGTGYTVPSGGTATGVGIEYKIVSSIQTAVTASAIYSTSNGGGSAIVVATYKAASSVVTPVLQDTAHTPQHQSVMAM